MVIMTDESQFERLEQYEIVAGRRLQWDTLLWQMPMMALTGEAFLLTIALYSSTQQWGRILSSLLAFVVAVASLHSLGAHRLSELTDSAWLHEHEASRSANQIHGLAWRKRRLEMVRQQLDSESLTDRLIARTYKIRSIAMWFWTLVLIALVALPVLVISVVHPALLGSH
jgi:hypothetical protein